MEKDCRKKKREEEEARKTKEEAKKKDEKVSSSVLAALMAKLEGKTNMVVVDPTCSIPPLGAICHQGGDYMSRHIAASNALEECKVGVKPPSTMVLSQAEPNPFKVSIETDLRSHCVRGYMSSFSQEGGGDFYKVRPYG